MMIRATRNSWLVALALAATLPLGGCGVVVGGGAVVGLAAAEERGIEGAARDTRISAGIFQSLFEKNNVYLTKVGVEVYEGKVLLTGVLEDRAMHVEAVRLAWATDGVLDVYDEIRESSEGVNFAYDTWITAQLKYKLTADKTVYSINYSIETVGGTIYLLGVALSQAELDRVIAHARSISYVTRVVSHVRVKAAP